MFKLFWRLLTTAPAIVGASALVASNTLAQTLPTSEALPDNSVDNMLEQLDRYNSQGDNSLQGSDRDMSQVTNVNQLRDVSPTDWAYEALRSLVERYGCIAGYPNQTYRGNQAMTRYEFAAGLNACLNQIERLIASSEAVAREDIETLQRLMEEFEAELATLGGRIDNLEGRTAFLEDNQFSTTTKLNGEVIFAVIDAFGDGVIGGDDTQTTFSDRVRLALDTSFTGDDLLRTRLQAGNVPDLSDTTDTNMARVGFEGGDDNDVAVDKLWYRFPYGESITAWVGATGLNLDDVFDPLNPLFESSGTGALSRFGRYNPLTIRGPEGTGAAIRYNFGDTLSATATYLTPDGNDPSEGAGLFNGSFSAGGQLVFSPFEGLDLGATYVYKYQTAGDVNLTASTGSEIGSNPYIDPVTGGPIDLAATTHNVGVNANWALGETFNISLTGGYAWSEAKGTDANAQLWTVLGQFGILDFGKEGAVLGLGAGIPPKVSSGDGVAEDENTSVLIEALYKYPLTDNIIITPGAYVVLNPNHNDENDTIVVGVLRTTFKF
ncbi:iron uptake porin [Pleurocapsales cyanobacterium LEGE 06147]|nr:iron uptake porin [Pleurocapsales cyanobacterium LEGE 06147]